ncbi:MAG: DsrE family protein [Gammaproteobacteria bacterium]|nr:DsrE family protein [Gammaproteobacteria bacterium]
MEQDESGGRREFLRRLSATAGVLVVGKAAAAEREDLRFPGEAPAHKLVYQVNKADPEYLRHILFSIGVMLRKYGDKISLVVSAFGPGIHILAKKPRRPVPKDVRERVASLAEYGVQFHACGETLKSLKWTQKDLLDFATVVDAGADDLMRLQEQGYAYISW